MDPGTMALIASAVSAAGSIGGGYLSGRSSGQETKMERTKRKLVDQLLSSLQGGGPFSDLFNKDEEAFQKSFVDPAKSLFNNQIAPQIQQQYIANGQQRGTGLEDQLLRAGVDLDQLLNQSYLDFQNQGKNRMQSTLNSILGGGSGGTQNMNPGKSLMQSTAGYLSSDAFSDAVSGAFKNNPSNQSNQSNQSNPYQPPPRKGFEPEWKDWKLGDTRWEQ